MSADFVEAPEPEQNTVAPETSMQQFSKPTTEKIMERGLPNADARVPKAKRLKRSTSASAGNLQWATHPDGSPVFGKDGMVKWFPTTSSDSDETSSSD